MSHSIASLDTTSSAGDEFDEDEELILAQEEWEESLEQLQQVVSIVLLPFLGKWLGRRWSHWAYARYLRLGLGQSFFWGERHLMSNSR